MGPRSRLSAGRRGPYSQSVLQGIGDGDDAPLRHQISPAWRQGDFAMKHSVEELIQLAYHYHPRGIPIQSPAYKRSKEYKRRLEACRKAAEIYASWLAMIRRLAALFPQHRVYNHAMYMLSPGWDIPEFAGVIELAGGPGKQNPIIEFRVSVLVPYYKLFRKDVVDENQSRKCFALPAEEGAVAARIAQEIEATFEGYEAMPPEVGNTIVPDMILPERPLDQATLYDCLMYPDP